MEISELKPLLNHPFLFILHVFLLDLIFGDPVFHLHPIRIMGRLIIIFEKVLMRVGLNGRVGGILLFVLSWSVVLGLTGIVYHSLLLLHWLLAWLWKLFICFSMFALKDLIVHARRIASATQNNQLEQARYHASMLVGRDTDKMDTRACNRAAVESVSESLVDSVIAPLFFLSIFGMAGLITFKIFSTMDSMVGYRSKEYLYFGWFGARMDDVLNFLPARVTWLLITIVSTFLPGCSPKKALLIGFKQHSRIPGPNAGWSECSIAGALKIRLAGPIWRDGKMVTDIWIGDPNDPEGASNEHIEKVIQISFGTTLLFLCLVYWSIFNLDFYFWFF